MIENIKINYKDDEIAGIYNHNDSNKLIIMIHGIASDKDDKGNYSLLENIFSDMGYDTFRYDLLGHGESSGNSYDLTIENGVECLSLIIDRFKDKYDSIDIIASSYGCSLACYVLDKINKCVFISPLLDLYNNIIEPDSHFCKDYFSYAYEKIQSEGYVNFGLTDTLIGINTFNDARKYKPYLEIGNKDILIIHGKKDLMVPYKHSERIASGKDNIKLILIEDGEHVFYSDFQKIVSNIVEYINN